MPAAKSATASKTGVVRLSSNMRMAIIPAATLRTTATRWTAKNNSRRKSTPENGHPATAGQVIGDHRPDAQEGVEQDHHEQRPVEDAPEDAAPADRRDPGRVLLSRVVQDVQDQVVGQRKHEEGHAGQAHQVPDERLRAHRPRGGSGCLCVRSEWSSTRSYSPKMGLRMMTATGIPTTVKIAQFRYQSCL